MKQKMSKFTPAMKQICIFVTVNLRKECNLLEMSIG